jgi:hypothetical protein
MNCVLCLYHFTILNLVFTLHNDELTWDELLCWNFFFYIILEMGTP